MPPGAANEQGRNSEMTLTGNFHLQDIERLFERMPSLFIGLGTDQRILLWNARAEQILGCRRSDTIGRTLDDCTISWDRNRVAAGLAASVQSGEPQRIDGMRCARPDGEPAELGLTIIPFGNGILYGLQTVISGADITERRVLEEQLSRAQKMQAIGHLAAGIAHEISTPAQVKPRILLVDDDPLLLAGLKRQLRRQFHIETAPGAREALQMVEGQDPYTVVVSDFRMPGMNGIDLLARIKTLQPDTVRMMLTGSTDLATAVKAVNEGHIFQFHLKPCPAEALAGAIQEGVAHFREAAARTSRIQAMEKSMALASEVQRNLMPRDHFSAEGLEVAGQSQWCDETGGDYYDFFSRRVDGQSCTGIVIGDVTGHGIPSALLMTTARAFLRERIKAPGTTAEIVTDVNRHLARDVDGTNRFMSMFYCEIDAARRRIRWTRAGHDPALIHTPGAGAVGELAGPGFPLPQGVMENAVYAEGRCELRAGQVIVIGTDGIWEARSPQGEYFGKNRLMDLIRARTDRSAREMAIAVIEALDTFRHPRPPEDDATLVVVKITA